MELNQREKLLLLVAMVILVPLLLFRFAFVPFNDYQNNQRRAIQALESTVSEIILLGEESQYLNATIPSQSSSLTNRVDNILRSLRIKEKSQITVENSPGKDDQRLVLKVDDINLTELTNLLYKIENSKPVIIFESVEIGRSFQNKSLFRISSALSGK